MRQQAKRFTRSEEKILALALEFPYSTKEIARRIGLSEGTVKIYISHLKDKLGMSLWTWAWMKLKQDATEVHQLRARVLELELRLAIPGSN